jgi:cytochrome c oxidase subunit 2
VQKFWAIVFGVSMLAAFLLFAVSPAMGWWLPENVSTYGGGVDWLFYLILGITGFFFVLTEAILVWALFRFASQPGRKVPFVHGNHRLEMVWTLIPGVILLLLGVVQIGVWADIKYPNKMAKPEDAAIQMEVTARQWEWRVRYPSVARFESWQKNRQLARDFAPHEDDLHFVNEIHVWKGSEQQPEKVLVFLTTQDVLHSFFLPQMRLKQDALPGKVIPVWFAATKANTAAYTDPKTGQKAWAEVGFDPGTGGTSQKNMIWELACAEYCGARHSLMRGKLYVHETRQDFLEWLRQAEKEQRQATASR